MFKLYVEHPSGGAPRLVGDYVSAKSCIEGRESLRVTDYRFAYVLKVDNDEIVSWSMIRSIAKKEK